MPAAESYILEGIVRELLLETNEMCVTDTVLPGEPEWFIHIPPEAEIPAVLPGDIIQTIVEDFEVIDKPGLPLAFRGIARRVTVLFDVEEFADELELMRQNNFEPGLNLEYVPF